MFADIIGKLRGDKSCMIPQGAIFRSRDTFLLACSLTHTPCDLVKNQEQTFALRMFAKGGSNTLHYTLHIYFM